MPVKEIVKVFGGAALAYAPKSMQTIVKEKVELLFWKKTLRKSAGTFYNGHMQECFTTLFGLTSDDYANQRVLDIGCGPVGTLEWCSMARERVGVDPLAREYERLNKGVHAMRYVESGAEQLPFSDGYFDIVSMFNSLDHVENVEQAMHEAQRVLRPGGSLLLIVEVGHAPTLTEPHALDNSVADIAAKNCEEIVRHEFGVRADHNIYGSIIDAVPRKQAGEPGILAIRYRKFSSALTGVGQAEAKAAGDMDDCSKSGFDATGNVARGLALITTVAVGLLATSADGTDQSGFVEEFDSLDRQRWFVSDGWNNGSYQNCLYSASAVEVRAGVLHLTLDEATDGPEDYLCAEVQSEQRFEYGTFEAMVRVPFASGTNSNFFTYIGPPQGVPHHEIDFEFIARTEPTLQTNTYVDGVGGNEVQMPVPETGDWYDIAFVWEPGRLRWYLDGSMIREEVGDTVPNLPQKMYLSIWSTDVFTEWLGELEWSAPLVLEVNRVAYTPLGAGCLFDQSLLCLTDFQSGDLDMQN